MKHGSELKLDGIWVTITIERPDGSTEGVNYYVSAGTDRETHHEHLVFQYDSLMRRVENG